MTIRRMQIGDYDEVYALWLSCTGMGLNDLDDSRGGIRRFLERNPETCFVAEDEGKIVGVILAGSDGRRGYIYHTAVHPAYRRRGIAGTLTEQTLDALQNLGIHKVAMLVFKKNHGANAFWESLGFTAREDLYYRNRALVEMVRIDT